jgi:hypothetical protein
VIGGFSVLHRVSDRDDAMLLYHRLDILRSNRLRPCMKKFLSSFFVSKSANIRLISPLSKIAAKHGEFLRWYNIIDCRGNKELVRDSAAERLLCIHQETMHYLSVKIAPVSMEQVGCLHSLHSHA